MDCPDCGVATKSPQGLASHRRAKHGGQPTGSNVAAIESTLGELERAGRLEPIDAAKVQAVRSMAAALDLNPFNSQMWREYRESLERLTADDSDDGALQALLDELSA